MFLLSVEIYLAALFIPVLVGAFIGLIPGKGIRAASAVLCGVSCIAGALTYPMFNAYGTMVHTFPLPSLWGVYTIMIDRVSSMMITASSIVFLMIIIHMVRSPSAPRYRSYPSLVCILFLSCVIAMCADAVLMLLIAWEMVTLTTFLMSYNRKNEEARWKFFIIAHLGGLMVVSAFILMCVFTGTAVMSSWSDLSSVMGPRLSIIAIVLLFLGFGTKLGIVPFHAWMSDLYAEAPTHTTAFLSTVSSNVAVLILFKSVFGFIGVTEDMHILAILLLMLASVTMVWGGLEALIQTEPKRILAYSSMVNMGLVMLCFSLGMLFTSSSSTELMTIALVAGLLHTINHSVFKSLMILTLGTVEDSTGETEMERMGGLASVLPLFSVFALIAVLSMAAMPPFNGFTSEWLMIQSLLGGEILGMHGLELILPIGVAVLGISGMMAAVSYARMYGFMFLGRPRSDHVAKPGRIARTTMLPLLILSALCLLLGLLVAPMADILSEGVNAVTLTAPSDLYSDQLIDTLNIPMLAAILTVIVASLFALSRIFRKNTVRTDTWGCGAELEENMQYSPAGFTQPLVKVFHPLYGDSIEIVDDEEKDKKRLVVQFREPFVRYLYEPIGRVIMGVSRYIGKMQNGNIQTYIGYILAALVALLLVVRLL